MLKEQGGLPSLLKRFYPGINISPFQNTHCSNYSDHEWHEWKWVVPRGFWKEDENVRRFMAFVGKETGVKRILTVVTSSCLIAIFDNYKALQDWHNVTTKQIIEFGGKVCNLSAIFNH